MKNRKIVVIVVIILSILVIVGGIRLGVYFLSTNLSVAEKTYLDNAHESNQVININVINNASVFGDDGKGIYYDFLTAFMEKYDLKLNMVTFNFKENISGLSLNLKTNLTKNDTLFYEDHYVLVSKNNDNINNIDELEDKTIGVTSSDTSYITSYIDNSNLTYKTYDDIDDLLKSFNEIDYAILPLHLYLDTILSEELSINYHFSDIPIYFVMESSDDTLSSILRKYYETWKVDFENSYSTNLFEVLKNDLKLTDADIADMQSITYNYGYVNNSPYEVISGGNYGGVAAIYLEGFMKLSGVDINFTKYKNYNALDKAIGNHKVDMYFGYNNLQNNFKETDNGIEANYVIVANNKNDIVVNSINSLNNKAVYVDKNSRLYDYISKNNTIKVNTYSSNNELGRLNNKDLIILIDENIYEYYGNHGLNNYNIRYKGTINETYGFKVSNDSTMYKLLNEYMSITDSKKVLNKGIYNHNEVVKSGQFLSIITRYIVGLIIILVIILIILIRKTKKISIAKRIKKEDKMRFIDQLTLLKNRNYLQENIDKWSKNTIYPQAIVVIGLNHLQTINDTEGFNEGDKQIKAAANVLINTQLDNTDIIRTDGNEFVVYLVGYSQKQITNYIHKINKEFKKLPYNYGAEYGYSMIIDELKTIEDALNEATKTLKEQKELNEKKN